MPKTQRVIAEYVQPKEPASGDHEGAPFVLNPSQVFDRSDPLVLAYPHLFEPLSPTRQRPAVEETTAIPGEGRPLVP